MVLPRLKATDYSVGWVCALPIELAAAQAMLDEKHAEPTSDDHDPNLYTLGRIGSHNVVLICLPAGQMGIGPATAGAVRMLSKFKSIRFGLMVGVGGGVPSADADVRLGDVVISQPHKQHGGVVQYDYGKTGKDGNITRLGSLSPPPKVLLNAVSQLRADRHLKVRSLAMHMSVFDRLRDFDREAAGPDVLFEATYDHDGRASCESCSKDRIIHRKPRRSEEEITMHYGTIASGNQVMKDGVSRDRLSAELGGVLCFEMEAAGLMNDFSCLVVRGICDYADSHKNKSWQPYAAATAAACAKAVLSMIPVAEVAATTEAAGNVLKHHVPFSLQGVPVVSRFVHRDAETNELDRLLLEPPLDSRRRNVVVVYGLGGIGKTQLVVEFARKYQRRYSGIFWLDGSTETSVKQSFVDVARRLPQDELAADVVETLKHSVPDVSVVVRECLQWLSITSNHDWLLIFDNVDRDFHDKDDSQAYDVKRYFPHADHGSILITSRLASLQKHGSGVKVGTVTEEQARGILEINAGKEIEDSANILERLHGLPLALAQAGSYIRETNVSASKYAKFYDRMWDRLMEKQGRFPLEEYGDRNMLTTWTLSYEQVRRQSKEAANLLKLWGFLDCGELWYEFIAASLNLQNLIDVPQWLVKVAENELEFADAVGLLSRYSLIDAKEGTDSYSMHLVLHRWCGHLVEGEEQYVFCSVAAGIVAFDTHSRHKADSWKGRKRILAHGLSISKRVGEGSVSGKGDTIETAIQPWIFHNLGYLLLYEYRQEAENMLLKALEGFKNVCGPECPSRLETMNLLGNLYSKLGRLGEAEAMYLRALQGREKVLGREHISTFETVNNLGILYVNLGRLEEAEKLFLRALQGKEKACGLDHISTFETANNLGNLYRDLGSLEEAEKMYLRALQGKEKVLGLEHISTLRTFNNLATLFERKGRVEEAEKMYLQVLEGYRSYGQGHSGKFDATHNLGNLYTGLGRTDEAEQMYLQALEGCRKLLGPENAWTLKVGHDLKILYKSLGKTERAAKVSDGEYEKTCGPDDARNSVH